MLAGRRGAGRTSSHSPTPIVHRLATHRIRQSRSRNCAVLGTRDPVVSPEWLRDNLEAVSVLDIRGRVEVSSPAPGVETAKYVADKDAYLTGHIPGAVFFDWTKDGIDSEAGVPVQLQLDPDLFAADLESKGVSTNKPVVVYDAGDGMFAARLWWMLMYHGHPQPLILEGGWDAWVGKDFPTELYEPCPLKLAGSAYFEAAPAKSLRVSAEEVLAAVGDPSVVLVDTRSADQYDAEVRRAERGGRIPGAVKLPRRALLSSGTSTGGLPLEEQQRVLEQVGVVLPQAGAGGQQQRVVLYCNGGVAACTAALALHRLGHSNWAVYDGSWNEWGNRLDLPVETPEAH